MSNNNHIAAFGELLLRLTPSDGGRLLNTRKLDMGFAGAETNVVSALALWGHQTRFISKLPEGPIGESAILSLSQFGVDTSFISRGPGRMGTYFIELGSSIRPSRVVYDRKNSTISQIVDGELAWPEILKGVAWLHLSGISLALSDNCLKESVKAVEQAKNMGVRVSFDMNFRRSLWENKEHARKAFQSVMKHTDLLFGNEGSLKDVFEWESSASTDQEKDRELMQKVSESFHIEMVAFTRRNHRSASVNHLNAVFLMDSLFFHAPSYDVMVSDRFGTGDSFAAAVLHGLCNSWDPKKIVDFGSAAFAFKHTVKGDQLLATEDEIISIAEGNIHGHVIR